jgi:hypothetical protein
MTTLGNVERQSDEIGGPANFSTQYCASSDLLPNLGTYDFLAGAAALLDSRFSVSPSLLSIFLFSSGLQLT